MLRVGGVMALVLPDESNLNTVALDPSHKHAFTPESFQRYLDLIGGFEVQECREVIESWSFLCVAVKTGE